MEDWRTARLPGALNREYSDILGERVAKLLVDRGDLDQRGTAPYSRSASVVARLSGGSTGGEIDPDGVITNDYGSLLRRGKPKGLPALAACLEGPRVFKIDSGDGLWRNLSGASTSAEPVQPVKAVQQPAAQARPAAGAASASVPALTTHHKPDGAQVDTTKVRQQISAVLTAGAALSSAGTSQAQAIAAAAMAAPAAQAPPSGGQRGTGLKLKIKLNGLKLKSVKKGPLQPELAPAVKGGSPPASLGPIKTKQIGEVLAGQGRGGVAEGALLSPLAKDWDQVLASPPPRGRARPATATAGASRHLFATAALPAQQPAVSDSSSSSSSDDDSSSGTSSAAAVGAQQGDTAEVMQPSPGQQPRASSAGQPSTAQNAQRSDPQGYPAGQEDGSKKRKVAGGAQPVKTKEHSAAGGAQAVKAQSEPFREQPAFREQPGTPSSQPASSELTAPPKAAAATPPPPLPQSETLDPTPHADSRQKRRKVLHSDESPSPTANSGRLQRLASAESAGVSGATDVPAQLPSQLGRPEKSHQAAPKPARQAEVQAPAAQHRPEDKATGCRGVTCAPKASLPRMQDRGVQAGDGLQTSAAAAGPSARPGGGILDCLLVATGPPPTASVAGSVDLLRGEGTRLKRIADSLRQGAAHPPPAVLMLVQAGVKFLHAAGTMDAHSAAPNAQPKYTRTGIVTMYSQTAVLLEQAAEQARRMGRAPSPADDGAAPPQLLLREALRLLAERLAAVSRMRSLRANRAKLKQDGVALQALLPQKQPPPAGKVRSNSSGGETFHRPSPTDSNASTTTASTPPDNAPSPGEGPALGLPPTPTLAPASRAPTPERGGPTAARATPERGGAAAARATPERGGLSGRPAGAGGGGETAWGGVEIPPPLLDSQGRMLDAMAEMMKAMEGFHRSAAELRGYAGRAAAAGCRHAQAAAASIATLGLDAGMGDIQFVINSARQAIDAIGRIEASA